jgi:hypothetical protein
MLAYFLHRESLSQFFMLSPSVMAWTDYPCHPSGDEGEEMDVKTQSEAPSTNFSFTSGASSFGIQQSPASSLLDHRARSSTNGVDIPRLLQSNALERTHFSQKPSSLTRDEALLVHHFAVHLGRWLDCTNGMRILTLRVPEMARQSPILFHAVLCFAARHSREDSTAEAAYQRCVTLLIDRLNEDSASPDEKLLVAVILLHFADQLHGEPSV